MDKLVHKVSTIVVGEGSETQVFRSMREVPPSLRRKIEKSTSGENAATLLIADERGRREIMRTLRGGESSIDSRLLNTIAARRRRAEQGTDAGDSHWWKGTRNWLEIGLVGAIGLSLWLLAAGK